MERHKLSVIARHFDERLITGTCSFSSKTHRWAIKANFLKDISNLTPSEILDLPLSNFGLCDISSINQFMDENNTLSIKKGPVNELFKIKYAMNKYPGEVNELQMRNISKEKLTEFIEKAKEDDESNKNYNERLRLAKSGISTEPSAVDATVGTDESHELSIEERLEAIRKAGGSRSVKRRKTHRRKTIKRIRSIKRRGTKRKLRKSKK